MPDSNDHIDPQPSRENSPEALPTAREQEVLNLLVAAARQGLDAALSPDRLVLRGLSDAGRSDALSASERTQLEQENSGINKALDQHAGLADVVRAVSADAALFDEVWDELASRDRPARRPRPMRAVRWPARIGLGLSAVVLVALTYLSISSEVLRTTATAPAGEHLVVQLADGSSARLSPGSALTYVPGAYFERTVSLAGQAYFDVSRDAVRFSVETPQAIITVLGTRFGVSTGEEQTDVVLVSGQVAVSPRSNANDVVILEPGEATRVTRGASPQPASPVEVSEALTWSGLLVFRETTMARVAELLRLERGVDLELGVGVADLSVTGTFGPESTTSEILDILAATLGAQVSHSNGLFLLVLE
ncbi:MAG: transmembrane sensor [Rhodothermales bacterium]